MNEVLIENWSCISNNWVGFFRDPYQHEFVDFALGNCLHGKVYGHPRIEDGHRAHTSRIKVIDTHGDFVRVETETGTIYRLGAPNTNFCKEQAESS